MRVKIVSDGTVPNTQVVDLATGKLIGQVKSIRWEANVNKPVAEVHLTVTGVGIEAEGNTEITWKPLKAPWYKRLWKCAVDEWDNLNLFRAPLPPPIQKGVETFPVSDSPPKPTEE